jgi:hypothetical protein
MTIDSSRHRRHRLAAVICTAVAAACIGLPNAHADPLPDPAPLPDQVILDTDAKPVINWSVPSRYDASWAAWTPSTETYKPDIINPAAWSLNLDGCASTAVHRISGYTFKIEQLGTTWTRTHETSACSLQLHDLPAQGYYRVTLTLHTRWTATLAGVSPPATRIVEIRDYLIVSMGDSLASGEGNPDVPGSYSVSFDWPFDLNVHTNRAAQWKNTRCHRSAKSGPSLAAKAFEDASPYTSVTFVSVACSGAEVRHLYNDPYEGIVHQGGTTVPPQVEAVAKLVGPSSPGGGRQIDALLISAGINDIGFSDIIERCLLNNNFSVGHTKCVYGDGIVGKLDKLNQQYAQLALSLAVALPSTREVYLNNYPSQVFQGGACGILSGTLDGAHVLGLGIDPAEGEEMNTWGLALSAKIGNAISLFRGNPYRWNRVPDLAGPFQPHAYCDNPTWFTSLEQSMATQGDLYGTAHPNAKGHVEYATLLRSVIVPNQASQPTSRVTVTLEEMKAAPGGTGTFNVDAVFWDSQDSHSVTRQISVPRNGQWTPVPPELGAFTYDMYVAPSSPRHATAVSVTLDSILPFHYGRNENYGVGEHELTHPTGVLAVRYRITSVPVGPPGNG